MLYRFSLMALGLGLLATGLALADSDAQPEHNPFSNVGQAYLVEIDGTVVWHKNANQRLPPASLTKLMTALLVVEQVAADTRVTVNAAAAKATGTRLGLRKGETFLAKDLLAATMVASANDACRALAEHVGGDQIRFVQRMNQRAQAMGMRNTRFANACGHDAVGHYSSAGDLRILAVAVTKNPQLAALAVQGKTTVTTVDGARRFSFNNTNALIGRYEGVQGIKTGTTPLAGKCLVALVRRGPHSVLLVLLKGKDRWWDTVDILDIAFARAGAPA